MGNGTELEELDIVRVTFDMGFYKSMPSYSLIKKALIAIRCFSTLLPAAKASTRPNLLYIMTDQQRFDAIQHVQNQLPHYEGKLKIRTPNMDRIMKEGAYFRRAYCHSPVCGPSRGVLRTGCTLERTGLQANKSEKKEVYEKMDVFEDKIKDLVTLDQVLSEDLGYRVEYYGKWHLPEISHFESDGMTPAVHYNDYDYEREKFQLKINEDWQKKLVRYLAYDRSLGRIKKELNEGDQIDPYTGYPYTPITIDSRYGLPTATPFKDLGKISQLKKRQTQGDVNGPTSLGKEHTATYYNGDVALKALDRLANQNTSFAMTVSFHNPHGPITPNREYLEYYWDHKDEIYLDTNIQDDMKNSAYSNKKYKEMGYDDEFQLKEWIACYYALIEEIDDNIGKLLDKLDEHGFSENTLIVFTADHGEMLGSHGMRSKNIFYEESVRIPLAIKLPGIIPKNFIIEKPVGHLDLYATILDYLGYKALNRSDGKSLRPLVDQTSFNEFYDEEIVVSEWDFRKPVSGKKMDKRLGSETNYMIVKGDYKLMVTKLAESSRLDMMYNLKNDPFEINNLMGRNGQTADKQAIGKAEHLKCLLVEWMERMDGPGWYSASPYSDSLIGPYSDGVNESSGDIAEVSKRRTWKKVDHWISDTEIIFGTPIWNGEHYIRNEYFYFGRSLHGDLRVDSVHINGPDAELFILESPPKLIKSGKCARVMITLTSTSNIEKINASMELKLLHDSNEMVNLIPLIMGQSPLNDGAQAPSQMTNPSPPSIPPAQSSIGPTLQYSSSSAPTSFSTFRDSSAPTSAPTNSSISSRIYHIFKPMNTSIPSSYQPSLELTSSSLSSTSTFSSSTPSISPMLQGSNETTKIQSSPEISMFPTISSSDLKGSPLYNRPITSTHPSQALSYQPTFTNLESLDTFDQSSSGSTELLQAQFKFRDQEQDLASAAYCFCVMLSLSTSISFTVLFMFL